MDNHLFLQVLLIAATSRSYCYDNVALGKPTFQSSNFLKYYSEYAVDGINETDLFNHPCSHTRSEANPWWTVDLQQTYLIHSMRIANRGTNLCVSKRCQDRLAGFDVNVSKGQDFDRVGNLCYTNNDTSAPLVIDVTCSRPLLGQYVTVSISRIEFLTLCEVEVYGELDGYETVTSSLIELSTYSLLAPNFLSDTDLGNSTTLKPPAVHTDTVTIPGAFLTTSSAVYSTERTSSRETIETNKDTQQQPSLINVLQSLSVEVESTPPSNIDFKTLQKSQLFSTSDTVKVSRTDEGSTYEEFISTIDLASTPSTDLSLKRGVFKMTKESGFDFNQLDSTSDLSDTNGLTDSTEYQTISPTQVVPHSDSITDICSTPKTKVQGLSQSLATETEPLPISSFEGQLGIVTVTQVLPREISTSTENQPADHTNIKQQSICECTCYNSPMSEESSLMSSILSGLHIDKSNTSTARGRYVCRSDSRLTVRVFGWISLSLLGILFGTLLLLDIYKIFSDITQNTLASSLNLAKTRIQDNSSL